MPETSAHPSTVDPRKYENNLEPPLGTMFFNTKRHNIFDRKLLHAVRPHKSLEASWIPAYTLTWDVQVYKYAVNGDPQDADFAKNGGQIYVIMVHSGTIECNDYDGQIGVRFEFEVAPHDEQRNVVPLHQFPTTGSGQKDDKNTLYEIDFKQTFQMINNGGSDAFSFNASYNETFTRVKTVQTGDKTATSVRFKINPLEDPKDSTIPWNTTHQIHAFSVFTSQNLGDWPRKFDFIHRKSWPAPDLGTQSIVSTVTIALGF
ncbi:hypothetical protein HGRIS_000083 [Hohenbuehelia grisea]|uniref:Uncharacterized protein n=1 Tax=Hohenbuehelia grisea TaxID=104357 RepID=A0ABR3JRB5_9AGAR